MAAPAPSAQSATFAFMVSIETGTPSSTDGRQDRLEPAHFLVERHRLGAAIGPGRFRADVDDVGALRDHAARMLDRGRGIEEPAAVGKRIRRDVEHAHHQRAAERQQARQRVRCCAPSAGSAEAGRAERHGRGFAPVGAACQAGSGGVIAKLSDS